MKHLTNYNLNLSKLQICSATLDDMQSIVEGIEQLQLDSLHLNHEQFIVAKYQKRIIGFGRLSQYADALELCSLGVLPAYRNKGIARLLVSGLLDRAGGKSVYVVCIIPDYFKKFGFAETTTFPESLKEKISYCTTILGGCDEEENYVVMRRG